MTGDSARPLEERQSRRERLHARHRAEDTWRRHEIAGRMKTLRLGLDKDLKAASALFKEAEKLLMRKPTVDTKELPIGELTEGKDE